MNTKNKEIIDAFQFRHACKQFDPTKTVSEEDLNDPNFIAKLQAITREKSRFPNNRVTLFLGVPNNLLIKAHMLVATLDDETRSSIKIVTLPDSQIKANGLSN